MSEQKNNRNRASKRKNKKRGRRGADFFFYGTIVIVLLIVVTGLWLKAAWDEAYAEVLPPDTDRPSEGTEGENERESLPDVMNILLLGLDSREAVMRADTVMLLTLNRRNDEINIISIPRDMRVELPGRGLDKINHAYAYGGVGLTREAVENFLGINIDHYMTTDFCGFESVVDILGGIEYEVETRMRYYASDVTIELDPGLQILDGNKALQYVRWRSDGTGDLGRVQRQQKLLKTIMEEMIAFRNVLKLPQLIPELAQNIKTDLELGQAIKLANKLAKTDFDQINTFTLPGRVGSVRGVSYVLPEEEEIRQLVERYVKGNNVQQS